jgi:cell division protein FtsQ
MTGTARRSPWGTAVVVLLMVGLAAWLVGNSALFAARNIRVLGNVRLTSHDAQHLAGVSIGDSLLRLDTEASVRSLERSPWVARASMGRSFPSTLVIRIEERTAAAWLRDREGPVLLAADGTVLERPRERPTDVPFVGRWGTALTRGQRIDAPAVLRVAATLPPELVPRIRSVTVEDGQLQLSVGGGGLVRYGEATALEAKHRALASVLDWARERRVVFSTIDLRIPGTPALEPLTSRG